MDANLSPGSAAPKHRRRWALVAAAPLAAAALALWFAAGDPLSDGERAMVGMWRLRWDGSASDLPLEYEFRPDRTCLIRYLDPATGAVREVSADQTWRRAGDTLVIRSPKGGYVPWWDVLGAGRSVREVWTLEPDGPGRFRYAGGIEAGWKGPGPPVSGTLTRSDAPP